MLAILADDLTGALDSAAPFAGRGLRTEVALHADAVEDIVADRPDVISINLNSREIDADDARALTIRVVAMLPDGVRIFKKVDSRLKGNVAAELDGIAFTKALMAPAIPEFDRIVEAGCLIGFGVETPIPVVDSLGPHAARAVIPDTGKPADMDAVLAAAETDGTDLLIGARGLAEALARRMTDKAEAQAVPVAAGRAMFVIGSRDPITLAQIEMLRASAALDYRVAPNGHLEDTPDMQADLTVVQASPGAELIDAQSVSEALAGSLKACLAGYDGTLLLSGGATAEAVMRALGVSRLTLHGECLPGLGLASSEGRCIIAKSGGFGKPDTLKAIAGMVLGRAI